MSSLYLSLVRWLLLTSISRKALRLQGEHTTAVRVTHASKGWLNATVKDSIPSFHFKDVQLQLHIAHSQCSRPLEIEMLNARSIEKQKAVLR